MFNYLKIPALVLALGLTSVTAQAADDKDNNDDKDEKEEMVDFATLPQVVQATFNKESDNQKIDKVEKEMEDGKVVYEAEVKLNGKDYEIEVAEDGTLLCKALEEEGDDEDDDDDKKEAKK